MSPVRTGCPVSGSVMPMVPSELMMSGLDHVRPLSSERMTATKSGETRALAACSTSVNMFTRVPLGSTTISLLMVWASGPGSKMIRAGSQLAPPLVLGENQAVLSPKTHKSKGGAQTADTERLSQA